MTTTKSIEELHRSHAEKFQNDVAKLVKSGDPAKAFAYIYAGLVLYRKTHTISIDEWLNLCPDIYHDTAVMKSLIELGYE